MKKLSLIFVAVIVAACANQNGLGVDGTTNGSVGIGGANGLGGIGTDGSISGGGLGNSASIEYFNETIGDTVLFPVDQSTLTPTAKALLDRQSVWLAQNNASVLIEGHADEQGTREYNLALGARRAAATRDYLVTKGIAQSRMSVVTFGKERPLEVCSTEECWSKNRRSVTVVK